MALIDVTRKSLDTLGERLRFRRKEIGWTQEYLAEQVGTSQAVIQKIENGKSLRPRKIDSIAQALNVSPAWLMFGERSMDLSDAEAMEVARAWSRLQEPYRSHLKNEILQKAQAAPPRVVNG